jgi:hypothetical protein
VLSLLDKCGVYSTSPEDRIVEAVFPNPLPEDVMDKLKELQVKKELGVPVEHILSELGYEK